LHSSSARGTAKSGHLLASVKWGRKKIDSEIQKFNKLVEKLPPSDQKLSPLDKKNVDDMLLTDEFWGLERFQSEEKWAVNSNIRSAITKRQLHDCAVEEIRILAVEMHRLVEWCSYRLDAVKRSLIVVDVTSAIGIQLLEITIKTCMNTGFQR